MYAKFKILEPLVGPQGLKVPLLKGLCPPQNTKSWDFISYIFGSNLAIL